MIQLRTLIERLVGREFIIKMKNESALDLDPFFNTYDLIIKILFGRQLLKE